MTMINPIANMLEITKSKRKGRNAKFVTLGSQQVTTNCSKSHHSQCGGVGGECECGCHL